MNAEFFSKIRVPSEICLLKSAQTAFVGSRLSVFLSHWGPLLSARKDQSGYFFGLKSHSVAERAATAVCATHRAYCTLLWPFSRAKSLESNVFAGYVAILTQVIRSVLARAPQITTSQRLLYMASTFAPVQATLRLNCLARSLEALACPEWLKLVANRKGSGLAAHYPGLRRICDVG